jgi:bla regulator protein BlaR1
MQGLCAQIRNRLAFVVICGVSASVAAQQAAGPTFEVASIKPNRENYGGWYNVTPTRYTATGNTVVQLISLAHDLRPYRVADAPEWKRTERFDIEASIIGPRAPGDLRVMLRKLLEKRFALRVGREKRPMEVFLLSMARSDGQPGTDLKRVDRTCPDKPQTPEDRCGHVEPPGSYRSTGERWEAAGFVNFIERVVGRPVLDRTGLTGQFAITLAFNPEITRLPDGFSGTLAELEAAPVLPTALREQVGLKLEPATEPVDVLVVDAVERPTPN